MANKMNARKARQRKMRNRRIALTVCLMLLVAVVSVGGTMAWLTAKTGEVKNTFTSADIDIDLLETMKPDGTSADRVTDWSAQLIPGKEYHKNPKVVVTGAADSVEAYLFVKFDADDSATYLDYTLEMNATGSGWTPVENVNNVWYRVVPASTTDQTWDLIVDDKVTVKSDLTATDVESANSTMTFTAYAIQTQGFATAELAWAEVSK